VRRDDDGNSTVVSITTVTPAHAGIQLGILWSSQ
jgi:hypothetical protein